ncbi:MAG: polyribonucleotide nucleotidyltransferase [Candidatus Nealsonbacteria bacterium RIFCSPLOWO2_01_FULL_43_32]|uniref:Polyribonucleotide nucleotidyltransferase n=1 Tax=Candidatus Nealsonbacteria bacterium RIFCSPLOWO2_01_FULL_43_32 TaxID=1801672 RepID=A0A1G2EDJ8_9BACT|nr:MAG: polyribonucleotide nucleotidyltransferase [Candidatus Nealsonbacteria bacterium RIFCSPLOWO2_01_FULL_43_32]HLC64117.1 polyribonucleotide nucleotidyltransferase [Patescibacteria group bacterium]
MTKETFKLTINGRDLVVELKDLAQQANGNVLVRYGDTVVLATAVMSKEGREGVDFFPLTVEYEERFYAAGKILGSRFIRRETKPSDEAILTARAIDRAIRPRFPKDFYKEVQVVVTCLSWDAENDPDVVGLVAASLALAISDIPWSGPIAPLRLARVNDRFILNPTYEERKLSQMDLLLVGMEKLINMIEMEGDEIDEKIIANAYDFAKPDLEKLIDFQKEIIKKAGKEKLVQQEASPDPLLEEAIRGFLKDRLEKAMAEGKGDELKDDLRYFIEGKYPGLNKTKYAWDFLEKETNRVLHENILNKDKRPDGRKLDEIRPIQLEAGLLPRTHGSGMFARGVTRALSILTLGTPSDVRLLEGMEIRGKKRFMHHYNFPPYCSGEVKPMRGPGRREIGHGMLAEKALFHLVPSFEDFPYTMRVVTEILSSNGSTSMASVSAASLALMDAGVPIKAPAAGIAIGLMSNEKGDYKLLTDIQGPEDHHGDMDFKAAGTKNGLTAMQMDVKVDGITEKILKEALDRAKKARLEILDKISKVLPEPRPELSRWAPRIYTLQINPDKIREVIGPGGKVINEIIEKCEVSIDIEDSGKVFITAEKEEAGQKAVEWVKNLTREIIVGEVFQGKVKRILNFGAFVEILPGQEGMVHISQLADRRVEKVEDVVRVGDIIPVKVIEIDEKGRINLSLKDARRR